MTMTMTNSHLVHLTVRVPKDTQPLASAVAKKLSKKLRPILGRDVTTGEAVHRAVAYLNAHVDDLQIAEILLLPEE